MVRAGWWGKQLLNDQDDTAKVAHFVRSSEESPYINAAFTGESRKMVYNAAAAGMVRGILQ